MARYKDWRRSGILLACLSFQVACAPSLIVSHVEPRSDEHPFGSQGFRQVLKVSAKSLFGYSYRPEMCKENSELQNAFLEEIRESSDFDLAGEAQPFDIELEACFHEADDAQNMEGSLLISGLTFGFIPTWYSRALVLEVTTRAKDGGSSRYVETDSYTAINWLPLTPFALYWGSPRVFENVAREQFRRVLAQLGTERSSK